MFATSIRTSKGVARETAAPNVARWLWGWPNRFLDRVNSVGSIVFVVGPYHGGDFSTGMDNIEELSRLPEGYDGGVLTNRESETACCTVRFGRRKVRTCS
ncbi:hypothetical protein N8E89_22415 (plasmid) [Phyllobacterium sp. A18/5-2]|uniref:hypothetical protein n=1 Tax=Phyllobacterium sp. A18/5-2 TaxID=2978392 RepID=UPI0021C5E7C6|nr:hypothetical protein [Phyllobacterium sp. A18/5-2]UXN67334.1 hypothetical protein N8E89_22415 [Phyllobacterium sp. A18/5-2]